jgi:hypothetical protein
LPSALFCIPDQNKRMKNYDFQKDFRAAYDKAVSLFAKGLADVSTYFDTAEKQFLAANGLTSQNFFDYAEDQAKYGEPGYDIALGIETARREYFLSVQNGKPSSQTLDETTMPAKTDAVRGIEWLPRIIPKTKAKLRGELPSSLMYCCGGDRRFFKAHDINPVEFLRIVWKYENNDEAIIDWVARRSASR